MAIVSVKRATSSGRVQYLHSSVVIGPHACGMPWSYCITSVGKEVTGFSTLLANQDENGEGEVSE